MSELSARLLDLRAAVLSRLARRQGLFVRPAVVRRVLEKVGDDEAALDLIEERGRTWLERLRGKGKGKGGKGA